VLKQRHETQVACALTAAFGKGRWGGTALALGAPLPQPGCRYEQQRGKVLRRGKVLALLRPVSITLQETLFDPPCCVQLRLHWRLEPTETGACVLLDARYSLNGAAALRRRHWYERIHSHCARMLGALESRVVEAEET
jgi:hypothetical protein